MSQSLGNYIGVEDQPADMYGKTMSIPDEAMPMWYRLASGLPEDDAEQHVAALAAGELEPVAAKRALAWAITARFHDEAAAEQAAESFRQQFAEHRIPEDLRTVAVGPEPTVHIPALLVDHLGVASRGEARRLIAGGAVRLDGETVEELDLPRDAVVGKVLQRGRRDFVRLVAG
jgi:tyrosyl-tRNA synthetase